MVGVQALTLAVLVRIQVPQPAPRAGVVRMVRARRRWTMRRVPGRSLAWPKRRLREPEIAGSNPAARTIGRRAVWRRQLSYKQPQQGSIPWPPTVIAPSLGRWWAPPAVNRIPFGHAGSIPAGGTPRVGLVAPVRLISVRAGFDSRHADILEHGVWSTPSA